jgi:hypothetical protein
MFRFGKTAAMTLASLLAACGGGGGGSAPTAVNSDTAQAAVSVEGSAVKGPLAGAKISFYQITASGLQGDLLGQTVSNALGAYRITINGYSGVVIAVASVLPGTTMYDEATGQTVVPAADFRLRASFAVESSKTYSAQINPFTDVATTAALAKSGSLSVANVAQANSDVAAMLSFNPLTDAPVFDADKKPTNSAAAALVAISQMALQGNLGCAAGTQAVKIACVTTTLSNKGLSDSAVKPSLQTAFNLVNDTFGLPSIAIGNPSGTPGVAASALEQTKAFIGALRSNAKALDAADLSLQTELQKVGDDMHSRTAPLAQGNIETMNLARLGIDFWNDVIKGDAPFTTGKTFFTGYENLGNCGFYSDTNYSVYATSKADARYVACGTAAQFIPATDASGVSQYATLAGQWIDTIWTTRVRLHPDATDTGKFIVYTLTRAAKRTLAANQPSALVETRTHYGAPFPGNMATLVTQRDSTGRVTMLNLTGEMSPAFSITRNPTWTYDSARMMYTFKPNAVATVLGDKHNVVMSAALTKVGALEKLALSGSIELIKAGALETRVALLEGSYLQANQDATGSYSAQDGSQEMLLKIQGGTSTSSVNGDLKIGAFKLDASGTSYIPTLASFSGSVQRAGVTFFEGALTIEALNHATFKSNLPQSNANFETTRIGFNGKVSIPNRAPLTVNLSATSKDTGSSATSATTLSGQYVQGLITVNVSGTGNATSDTITLESTGGVKLVIDRSKTLYPLTKDGQTVGQFNPKTSRVTYTDNSYEQF